MDVVGEQSRIQVRMRINNKSLVVTICQVVASRQRFADPMAFQSQARVLRKGDIVGANAMP